MATVNGQDVTSSVRAQAALGAEIARTQRKLAEIENDLGRHIDELFGELHAVRQRLGRLERAALPSEREYQPKRGSIAVNGGVR